MKDQPIIEGWEFKQQVAEDELRSFKLKGGVIEVNIKEDIRDYCDHEMKTKGILFCIPKEAVSSLLQIQAQKSYSQGIEDAFKEIHNLGYSVFQAQEGIHPPAIEIERLENLKCKLLKNQSDEIS